MKLESRPKTASLCLSINGFMRNNKFPKGYDIFEHDNGSKMTPAEAMTFLSLEKAKGHKVIPFSEGCSNPCKQSGNGCTGFDYSGGGCPGYYCDGQEGGAA